VLWSRDTRERALGDISALQDEIAREVVAELSPSLVGERSEPLVRKYTESVDAYQAYWKGRYFWNKRTEAGLRKSIEYFEEAIQADPGYALAHVGLADAYLVLKSLSLVTPEEARFNVDGALKRALQLDETLGEAHKARAWMEFTYDWKWLEADREFRRAIELQPNDATTHQWYAEYLSAMGRFDESVEEIQRAQQLDPPSAILHVIAAQIYFFARRYDETIEQCRKALELDPDFYIAHDYLGWAYLQKRMYEPALAAVTRAKEIEDTPLQLLEIASVEAALGDRDRARSALRDVLERSKGSQAPQHTYRFARIYAALREPDAAFERLEKAFREREEMLVWLDVDPHLDSLREDARFEGLRRRVGFTESP
jgi:tetratricopeptide (TPR) repeat protein